VTVVKADGIDLTADCAINVPCRVHESCTVYFCDVDENFFAVKFRGDKQVW